MHIAATINALTLMIFVISVEFILLGILYLYMMFDPERHFICAYPFSDIFPVGWTLEMVKMWILRNAEDLCSVNNASDTSAQYVNLPCSSTKNVPVIKFQTHY